ncbi:MAG TPA: DUF4474 domain-containing protein [Anaerovoracaceae bacterium]|nr:DUF4474 domain-containing protein [Anaerovoracaceae bacterium]
MLDIIQLQLSGGLWLYPVGLAILSFFVILGYRLLTSMLPQNVQTDEKDFDELLSDAGYEYDPSRDIFITKMNCWQKKYGYCRLYDEACPPMCLIIDSEPVEFDYNGKHWLIEFWKGQYYLNTGFEIGVYNTDNPELDIPELFTGTLYDSVGKEDMLEIQFILYKNGKELFFREEKHWWLTGFKTGEFSEPSELTARIRIAFKDTVMCHNFIKAMKKIGYQDQEILTNGIVAEFMFDKPHTEQPLTRTADTDWIMQRYNEHCCKVFQDVTAGCNTWPEKLTAIRTKEPYLYKAVIGVGKTAEVFKAFSKLKKHSKKKMKPKPAKQPKPPKQVKQPKPPKPPKQPKQKNK